MNPTAPQPLTLGEGNTVASELFCHQCGASLRGLTIDGACPGCATSVTATAARAMSRVDIEDRVCIDILCRTCGYNLRSQPITGICSECGSRVSASAFGYYLYLSNPAWVRKLSTGAAMLAWSFLVIPMMIIAQLVLESVSRNMLRVYEQVFGPCMGSVVALGSLLFLFLGVFRVTTPDPARARGEEGLSSRRLTRVFTLLTMLSVFGTFAWTMLAIANPGLPTVPDLLTFLLVLVGFGLLPMGAILCLIAHLRRLMIRIPSPRIATFARTQFWITGISWSAYTVALVILIVSLLSFSALFGGLPGFGRAVTTTSTANTVTTNPPPPSAAQPTAVPGDSAAISVDDAGNVDIRAGAAGGEEPATTDETAIAQLNEVDDATETAAAADSTEDGESTADPVVSRMVNVTPSGTFITVTRASGKVSVTTSMPAGGNPNDPNAAMAAAIGAAAASAPAFFGGPGGTPGQAFSAVVMGLSMMVGSCGLLVSGISGIVLLIMVRRALADAAEKAALVSAPNPL